MLEKPKKDLRLDKCSNGDISANFIKQCDLCFQALTDSINQSIVCGKFPDSLKLAIISLVYEANDPLGKTNYEPAGVLLLCSKIYERLIFDQLSRHSNKILSKLLFGFRKPRSTEHALFGLLRL